MRCWVQSFLILFVVILASAKTNAESTGNLLSNDFTDGTWSTNIQSYHGSNTIAGVDGQYVESTITLSDHMNSIDIDGVYQSDLTADIWFWNNESQSVTLSQTITDSNGKEYSNNTVVSGTCATWNGCDYGTAPNNSIYITDVADDYDIVSKFSFTVPNQPSGHYGADLRNPSLILYFEPFKVDVESTSDIDLWVDNFEMQYMDEFDDTEFSFSDTFTEEFTMPSDYYLFENDMYLYMTPEEEVSDAPVEDVMTDDVEEYIEEFEEAADETEENFFSDEPATEPAGDPQPVTSITMMAEISGQDKVNITVMIKDQPVLQDVVFYEPIILYPNQLSLSDNRDIYSGVVYIANDPLTIQIDKQRENQEQQYKLQQKLESMTWKN